MLIIDYYNGELFVCRQTAVLTIDSVSTPNLFRPVDFFIHLSDVSVLIKKTRCRNKLKRMSSTKVLRNSSTLQCRVLNSPLNKLANEKSNTLVNLAIKWYCADKFETGPSKFDDKLN